MLDWGRSPQSRWPMKKFILSLLVLCVSASISFAQNKIDETGKRQGPWVITAAQKKLGSPWLPDQTVEEGSYTNSMKTGIWIEYYQNGNKKSELTYVNNRPNGPAKMYFENGNLSEEGTWVGTRWTGPYKLYYEDGTPRQQFVYNNLGQRDGAQVYYHPNGKVAIEVNMKAGKEEGVKKEYNTNGELTTETYFNGGTIDPAKTKTYEPKKPESAEAVKAPEEKDQKGTAPTVGAGTEQKSNIGTFNGEGYWILYKNGQITMKGTFAKRKLVDGEERVYDSNGILIQVKLYKGGKYVGDGPLPTETK
jgi:antitoxin component YwqK of YwqJK toxin-antitoxin module